MTDRELPKTLEERVSWVVAAPDQTELERRYDLWARKYDADVGEAEAYRAPVAAAEVAARYLDKSARILDAGAGTGLSGEALHAAGFDDLVAVDISAGMLEQAQRKGVYREIRRMDLGRRIDFDDDRFDAVVTVGTTSQMPAASLREFVRVVRPGGHIVFTVWVEAFIERGYAAIQEELEVEGRLAVIFTGEPFQVLPTSEPHMYYEVWVFEVLAGEPERSPATSTLLFVSLT
jgi:predicted TPR repeat methyltransferase